MKNRKSIIFSIIGVSLILLILIGATYAYFQAQIKDGASSEVAIDTDTVDVLTFKASNDISFDVMQENFKEGAGNKSGTTILNAHLIANNTNQTASYKYNVYLDITKNNFVYSKDSSTPEIVLIIKNPSGQYVTTTNSKIGNKITVDLNGEQVTGYDITTKIGLIEISLDYLIEATPTTKGLADQDWQISVVLVNLDSNQVANAGKSFKAKAKVQSEKINILDLGGQYDYYKSISSNSDYRDKIKNVYFVNHIVEEELNSVGTDANWDLSSVKDKSIMGWLKNENEDETAPYNLYIGSNLKEGEKIVLRSFAYAFYNMQNLEKVDLNLDILDTSNLNDVSYMFYYNSKLTNITGIEELDVSNVTNMSYTFAGSSLTTLDLSKWNTHNVTNMSGLFSSTSYNYDVSKIDTSNVTDMTSMFASYKGTEIIGIEKLDVSNVTNMSSMFYNISSLAELDLSKWDTLNVTDMSRMFQDANSLTSLDLSTWNTHSVIDMFCMFYSYKGTEIKGIENLDASNVTNMSYMFYSISGLTELDLSKWNVSNVTNMTYMFYRANGLTKLNLSNWKTSNVTNMAKMFFDASSLTELDLSNWDTSNVTNMSYMFSNASSLTELDLSNWDTSNVTNMSSMFYETSSLTSIDMRKAIFSQVTSYDRMFSDTNSALKITVTGKNNKDWLMEKHGFIEKQINLLSE